MPYEFSFPSLSKKGTRSRPKPGISGALSLGFACEAATRASTMRSPSPLNTFVVVISPSEEP